MTNCLFAVNYIGDLVHDHSQTHLPPPTRRTTGEFPRFVATSNLHWPAPLHRDVRIPFRDGVHLRRCWLCARKSSARGLDSGVWVYVLGRRVSGIFQNPDEVMTTRMRSRGQLLLF
jgi:hypothetical protein